MELRSAGSARSARHRLSWRSTSRNRTPSSRRPQGALSRPVLPRDRRGDRTGNRCGARGGLDHL